MSALPRRHRGAHLPDFVRTLETVGGKAADARAVRRNLAALHPPPTSSDSSSGTVFANLAVWIDATVRASSFHAGPAKLRLYAAFLRVLVRELMPDDRLRECVQQIDAYVAYLLNDEDAAEPVASPHKPATRPSPRGVRDPSIPPYVPVKMALAPRHQPMAALLSPRVLQQFRRSEPSAVGPPSPLKRPTRPSKPAATRSTVIPSQKTLIELSDHEEAMLELALFFQESVDQLAAAALRSGTASSIDWATRSRAGQTLATPSKAKTSPILTSRWPQLSVEAKKRALAGIKRRLTRQKFFGSSDMSDSTLKHKPDGINSTRTTGEPRHPSRASHTVIEPSKYLTLVLLCLHETIRRASVFTQELAQFAWLHLCEEPLGAFERALEDVERQRTTASDDLQRLRSAKEQLQTAIHECEARIQQLQTRNMASMRLWRLEQREADHFAREEQWHGQCKALMLRSLALVAAEVNVPTWCELVGSTDIDYRDSGGQSGKEAIDTGGNCDDLEETTDGEQSRGASRQPDRLALLDSPRYECLAPGAALLDDRLRFQLTYVSHLLILCRSYLHLHERRAARDVVEATETTIDIAEEVGGDGPTTTATLETSSDSPPGSPTSASRLIASISRHELETLRELSEALRAIEVVYAATTGERPLYTGGGGVASTPGLSSCCRLRDAATQFPEALDGNLDSLTGPRAFLRSLAFCTIAATSFAGASSFVPAATDLAGSSANSSSHGTPRASNAPAGSGRRRGSAMFKLQGLAVDSSTEQQPPKVMIRLDRAVHKLPKHMKELLLLLEPSQALGSAATSPFTSMPSTTSVSNDVALSESELVTRIQAIYSQLAQATNLTSSSSASTSWSLPSSLSPSPQSNLSPPLGISLAGLASSPHRSRPTTELSTSSTLHSPESLVQEVYALFLDAAEGSIALTEREFVRFFASIQLFLSKAASSSGAPSSTATPRPGGRLTAPVCHEVIHLFATLTKLYYLPAPDRSAALVPRRLFEVVTYCQRVLDHVSVDKERLQVAGGRAFDIWVAASSSPPSSPPPSLLYPEESACAPPLTPTGGHKLTPSAQPQPHVLLDSAKLLLVHIAGISTSPSSILSLEDSAHQLDALAAPATVSLANATTPAPYNQITSTSKSTLTGQYQQPNGLLTDAMILPLQAAVAVIARAWLERLAELQKPLRVAFKAALTANGDRPVPAGKADDGRLSFSEFLHVMTNGQPHSLALRASSSASTSPWESTGSTASADLTYSQLAQLYASAISTDRHHHSPPGGAQDDPSSLLGARWTTLARIVADELDLTNVCNRFSLADMRSIEHAVVGPSARSGGSGAVATALLDLQAPVSSIRHSALLPWLLRPPYSMPVEGSAPATAAALTKSWTTHRSVMMERFVGAAQAESSAIDGVLSWQSGLMRSRLVDKLVPRRADEDAVVSRKMTASNGANLVAEGGLRGGETSEPSGERKSTATAPVARHEQLSEEQIAVSWAAVYSLQLEHARAHQLVGMADRVGAKQQQQLQSAKVQKAVGTTTKAVTAASSAPK